MVASVGYSLTQLQHFIAAAEAGNISVAADRLHVSQSAMSSSIMRLERRLGCELFLRKHARGITLTANGQRLLGEARALLRQAHDLEESSRTLQHTVSGELAVGCFVTLAPFYIPPVVRILRQEHPQLNVRVHEGNGDTLTELLRSGTIETGIFYDIDIPRDLQLRRLAVHRPYALVDAEHPLADRGSASLRELARSPMVLLDLPQTRRFIMAMLARADVTPASIVSTTSFETMRGLVAAGEGFTILNQRVATDQTYDGRQVHALEIDDQVETVQVGAVSVRDARLSRRAECFIEASRREARRSAAAGSAP